MPSTSRDRSVVQGAVFQQALGTHYRFWAAVRDVAAVVFLDGRGLELAAVERPTFPPGVCRECGCSEFDACMTDVGPCAWADRTQTICTRCQPPRRRGRRR